jgi:hypothetical protein
LGGGGGEIFKYALAYVFEFLKFDAIFAAREKQGPTLETSRQEQA